MLNLCAYKLLPCNTYLSSFRLLNLLHLDGDYHSLIDMHIVEAIFKDEYIIKIVSSSNGIFRLFNVLKIIDRNHSIREFSKHLQLPAHRLNMTA